MASSSAALELISKTRVVVQGYAKGCASTAYETGCYHRIAHKSTSTSTKMIFGLFLPSTYTTSTDTTTASSDSYNNKNTPVMFWLSGLTCDDTNFAMKAGSRAFEAAEKHGIAIVMPDTSPRPHGDESTNVPNVNSYDMGIGAGFYVNATQGPYDTHYHMYDYITKELPDILETNFNLGKNNSKSICGHSMGGHGALTIALREGKEHWKSVSAFSPICNPVNCPWGEKAFTSYLGSVEAGKDHDATNLVQDSKTDIFDDILIEQGTDDNFLKEQLKTEAIVEAAEKKGQKLTVNMREGFDHSYYFIAAFIENHVDFHAKYLKE